MLRALYAFRIGVLAVSLVVLAVGVVTTDLETALLGAVTAFVAMWGIVRYRLVVRLVEEERRFERGR